jgi:3-hydroxypropanoate dehydrogenase
MVPETGLLSIGGDMTDTKVIFEDARTYTAWQERPVTDDLLRQIYDLAKLGPTSSNCCPMRVAFVKSAEAKARLKPCLSEGNVEKTMKAPATAIVYHDTLFYDLLSKLFPHHDMRSGFAGNADLARETAFRNGSLQGAYLIIAARALGLDCGPMSGFDNAKVDAEFFPDGRWKSNFLCNLGYGDPARLRPRNPRPPFEEACRIL